MATFADFYRKKVLETFSDLHNAVTNHRAAVTPYYEAMRDALSRAKQEAGQYKDEEAQYRYRESTILKKYKPLVEASERRVADAVYLAQVNLTEILHAYAFEEPNQKIRNVLKMYFDFGLEMDREEIELFAKEACGNYISLRSLEKLAANSGWEMQVPNVGELKKEITSLRKLLNPWQPEEYLHESLLLGRERWMFRNDGTIYKLGEPHSSTTLLAASAAANEGYENIDSMCESWKNRLLAASVDIRPITQSDENGNTVVVRSADEVLADAKTEVVESLNISSNAALDHAKEYGRRKKKGTETAHETVKAYSEMGRVFDGSISE